MQAAAASNNLQGTLQKKKNEVFVKSWEGKLMLLSFSEEDSVGSETAHCCENRCVCETVCACVPKSDASVCTEAC